jgi:fibronectin type 3 domain-containing protein
MKNISLVLAFLFFGNLAIAQNENYTLSAGFGPNGSIVQLKWLSKTPLRDKSFVLYRRVGVAPWEKITAAPIAPSKVVAETALTTAQNPFPGDSSYLAYAKARNRQQTAKDPIDIQNLDFGLYVTAISDNRMARHLGIYAEDKTVDATQTYTYRLSVLENGKERDLAVSNAVSLSRKPLMPIGVKAEAGDKTVKLNWQASSSYFSYRIYRGKTAAEKGELVGEVMFPLVSKTEGKPEFSDKNLVNGSPYYYKIAGVDYLGNEWSASVAVSATPNDKTAPAAASELKISRTSSEISLRWKPASDADIVEQNVWRANKYDGQYQKINSKALLKTAAAYSDTKLPEGAGCYYYIETIDRQGNVSLSNKVSITVPDQTPPAAPKGFTARCDTSGRIFLNWQANKEGDLLGYRIYRSIDKTEENFNLLQAEAITGTSFMDKQPRNVRNPFVFRLTAIDKFYNESKPTELIARLPDVEPPMAPVIKSAKYVDRLLTLEWYAQENPDLKGYHVYRKSENDSVYTRLNTALLPRTQLNFTERNLPTGLYYSYALQAVDSSGLVSGYSAPRMIDVPKTKTELPETTLFANYDSTLNSVLLTVRPKTPLPADSDFKYVVQRKLADGDWMRVSPPLKEMTYKDVNVKRGEVYHYRMVIAREGEAEVVKPQELRLETGR